MLLLAEHMPSFAALATNNVAPPAAPALLPQPLSPPLLFVHVCTPIPIGLHHWSTVALRGLLVPRWQGLVVHRGHHGQLWQSWGNCGRKAENYPLHNEKVISYRSEGGLQQDPHR